MGKVNDSNYDGNCTARHFRFGTSKISDRWIFFDSVPTFPKLISDVFLQF